MEEELVRRSRSETIMTMATLDPLALALAQVTWALAAEVQDLSQEAPAMGDSLESLPAKEERKMQDTQT